MNYCTKCGKEIEAGKIMCKECIDAHNQAVAAKSQYKAGSKRDGVFAIILFGITALIIDCLLFAGFGIGTSISLILLTVIAAVYLKSENGFNLYAIITGALSVVSAVAITVSNDKLVVFLSFVITLMLYTVMIYEWVDKCHYNE